MILNQITHRLWRMGYREVAYYGLNKGVDPTMLCKVQYLMRAGVLDILDMECGLYPLSEDRLQELVAECHKFIALQDRA